MAHDGSGDHRYTRSIAEFVFTPRIQVELYLEDGTRMERTGAARGSEKKFASESEFVERFEKLAAKVLPRDAD